MSPVIPLPGEIDFVKEYELMLLTGWVHSQYSNQVGRKKKVTAITEGSVFSRPINGQLVDVAPSGRRH